MKEKPNLLIARLQKKFKQIKKKTWRRKQTNHAIKTKRKQTVSNTLSTLSLPCSVRARARPICIWLLVVFNCVILNLCLLLCLKRMKSLKANRMLLNRIRSVLLHHNDAQTILVFFSCEVEVKRKYYTHNSLSMLVLSQLCIHFRVFWRFTCSSLAAAVVALRFLWLFLSPFCSACCLRYDSLYVVAFFAAFRFTSESRGITK